MDICRIVNEFVEISGNIEFEIDFENDGAVAGLGIGCPAGIIGVVDDCGAETGEDGNGCVEGVDFRIICCCYGDTVSWDTDSCAEKSVGDTCCGVVGNSVVGERNCGSVVILSD